MLLVARTVLVVEDEWLLRWSIQRALGGTGRRVVNAADAEAALRLLAGSESPDVLILGSGLRERDQQFLRAVRARTPDCRVILISPLPHEAEPEARRLGAMRVFPKPVDLTALAHTVRDLLRRPAIPA